MRYRKLGPTGLVVSEICFGTMTFGGDGFWTAIGTQDQATADSLVKNCINGGVTFFDTADIYSNGLSEKILGQSIRNLSLARDQIVIASKCFGRMGPGHNEIGLSRKHILSAIDASLARLQLDHLDLYQVHGTDPVTPLEETMEALDACVKAGKVRYVGFCNMQAWAAVKANAIADARHLSRFVSAQIYYSIAGRDIERELVPAAKDQGLAILPWSPLAGGFLSGKFLREGQGPQGSRRTTFDFPPIERERAFAIMDAIQPMAKARDCSVARIALAWLLHQSHVTSVIIGAKTEDQLADNLLATEVKLTADELKALDAVSALPREYPGWMLERQGGERRALLG
ncbi:MAG: aldo/keto reductase [Alphaproteobacteria bacterium]|nr:aldo/keto reductase [Alphaproteobacteria bacterium]